MNYIYDIILNFQKEYYDFYEWNNNDHIYHMRKIPIIKVNNKQLLDIKNSIIKFKIDTLKFLNVKAEQFKNNDIAKLKYTFIVGNNSAAIAIKLNNTGIVQLKSSLLLDEQEDAIEILRFKKEIKLNYQIIKKRKPNHFKTRFEKENENFIYNELEHIFKHKNFQKLNYLYLECFNKPADSPENAYTKIKEEIKKRNKNFQKLYKIFKVTKQK